MGKSKRLTALLVAGIILTSCSSNPKQVGKPEQASSIDSIPESKVEMKNYEGAGIVISIPPNKKQIIIKHGVIPGFMEAMTMPFNVPDSLLLEGIHPKDSVKIFIDYDGTNVVLKKLKKIQ